LALFLLALAALCVAVARPHVHRLVPRERATTILVIDASRSMESRDIKPSRLGAAQEAVRTFLERVPKRMRVGLIVFAGDAQVAAPPTTDRDLVRESAADIDRFAGFGGTAIGDALAAAAELGAQAVADGNASVAAADTRSGPTHGLVSILFLSDGAQTRGTLLPLEGADRAKAAGIPVYTVALGTPHGTVNVGGGFGGGDFSGPRRVPPDPATLRAIAQRTGGKFFAARSSDSLQAASGSLARGSAALWPDARSPRLPRRRSGATDRRGLPPRAGLRGALDVIATRERARGRRVGLGRTDRSAVVCPAFARPLWLCSTGDKPSSGRRSALWVCLVRPATPRRDTDTTMLDRALADTSRRSLPCGRAETLQARPSETFFPTCVCHGKSADS
jgi:hypothetical protein